MKGHHYNLFLFLYNVCIFHTQWESREALQSELINIHNCMYDARPEYILHQRASVLLYFVMGSNLVEVCECAVENEKRWSFFTVCFCFGVFKEEFAKEQTEAVLPPTNPIHL